MGILGKKVKQTIAECKNIDEAKKIRDKASALKAYARQAKESQEVQNNVCEIKLRAERRIGEFSRELPKEQGDYKKDSSHDRENPKITKLYILKDAATQDAIDIAELLIYAEAKLGGMLKGLASPTASRAGRRQLPDGITKKLSHQAQEIERNLSMAEQLIEGARETGNVPSPHDVLKEN